MIHYVTARRGLWITWPPTMMHFATIAAAPRFGERFQLDAIP